MLAYASSRMAASPAMSPQLTCTTYWSRRRATMNETSDPFESPDEARRVRREALDKTFHMRYSNDPDARRKGWGIVEQTPHRIPMRTQELEFHILQSSEYFQGLVMSASFTHVLEQLARKLNRGVNRDNVIEVEMFGTPSVTSRVSIAPPARDHIEELVRRPSESIRKLEEARCAESFERMDTKGLNQLRLEMIRAYLPKESE